MILSLLSQQITYCSSFHLGSNNGEWARTFTCHHNAMYANTGEQKVHEINFCDSPQLCLSEDGSKQMVK